MFSRQTTRSDFPFRRKKCLLYIGGQIIKTKMERENGLGNCSNAGKMGY